MKKARLTEEQIIGVLQEHGAGEKRTDLCRKHGDVGEHVLCRESEVFWDGGVRGEAVDGT
jgi:hypothetical protein